MKLSEAICLGSMLLKPSQNIFNTKDSGCALHMAMAAIGDNRGWLHAESVWPWIMERAHVVPFGLHPWFYKDYKCLIISLFGKVMAGEISLGQLVAWVATVEPAETQASPSDEHSQVSMADLDFALKAK